MAIKAEIQKQRRLLKRIMAYGMFVRGSISNVCATCNRARCICRTKSTCRAYRLTYKDGTQRTRTVYIPAYRLPKIKRMLANYSKIRETIEKLIQVNIEIFKNDK